MIIIETKLKVLPQKCSKCKFSYYRYEYDNRFCAVAFTNGFNRACPYEYNKEKNNWEYRKPSWCPLRQLEAETNGAFTFGGNQ